MINPLQWLKKIKRPSPVYDIVERYEINAYHRLTGNPVKIIHFILKDQYGNMKHEEFYI